jgi:hypothetical protein
VIFWPKEEIAIDAFHYTVYAVAYELIDRCDGCA